jgi:hypothetical protein
VREGPSFDRSTSAGRGHAGCGPAAAARAVAVGFAIAGAAFVVALVLGAMVLPAGRQWPDAGTDDAAPSADSLV